MTRGEQEILVERYLAFEMTAAEEQEFIIRTATDRDLHRMLRSSRLVQKALERNRATLPSGHLDVRDRALSLLAATPVVQAPAEPSPMPEATRGIPAGWLSHLATAILFSVGGFLMQQILPFSTDSRSAHPAAAPALRSIAPTADDTLDRSNRLQTAPRSGQVDDEPSPAVPRAASPVATGRPVPERSAPSARRGITATLPATVGKEKRASDGPREAEAAPSASETPAAKPSPSVKHDSISFRARINLPK